jgi:hypothetical protein
MPLRTESTAEETTPLLAASGAGPTAQPNEEGVLKSNGNGILHANGTGKASTSTTAANGHAEDSSGEDEDKPLPKVQIFLLCFAKLTEPITFFSIFPFVNKMIHDLGIKEANVGFYAGVIVCLCPC